MKDPALPYSVESYDNFHPPWGDEDADPPINEGSFATAAEAIAKARSIIDKSLMSLHQPGESYEDLISSFRCHGEVPMVFGPGDKLFDSYAYVHKQCLLITSLSAAETH